MVNHDCLASHMSHKGPSTHPPTSPPPTHTAHHRMGHARACCAQIIHNPQSGNNARSETFPAWRKRIRNARYRPAFLQLQWGLKTLKKDQRRPSGLLVGARAASGVVSFIPILPYLVSIFVSLVAWLLGALPQRPRLGIHDIYRCTFTSQFLVSFGWTKFPGMSVPIVFPFLQEIYLTASHKGGEKILPSRPSESYLVT